MEKMTQTEFFLFQTKKSFRSIIEKMAELVESGQFDEILKKTECIALEEADAMVDNRDEFCKIMSHHSNVNALFMAKRTLDILESAFVAEERR